MLFPHFLARIINLLALIIYDGIKTFNLLFVKPKEVLKCLFTFRLFFPASQHTGATVYFFAAIFKLIMCIYSANCNIPSIEISHACSFNQLVQCFLFN